MNIKMFLNITIFNWNIIEKNKKMNKFVAFARILGLVLKHQDSKTFSTDMSILIFQANLKTTAPAERLDQNRYGLVNCS